MIKKNLYEKSKRQIVFVSVRVSFKLKIMSKKLDLASQQFIGYYAGKWGQLIGMIEAMGLTEKEWIKLKRDYPLDLTDSEIQEINEFFNPPKDVCYKTNEVCKYDCPGICRDSV